MNEAAVGEGIKDGGIAREQLFVTTKLWIQHAGYEPTRQAIAAKHGKTIGQVVLRWVIQRGVVALAKTTRKERMAEILAIFDFELDTDDLARIANLDTGASNFFSHRNPAIVKWLSERKLEI